MQVTLDPAALVFGFITILIGLLQLFGMSWIRGVQEKQKESEVRDAAIQRELSQIREAMGRDYVQRSEQRDLRDEFRDGLVRVNQQLTDINNKLDRKQDKQ